VLAIRSAPARAEPHAGARVIKAYTAGSLQDAHILLGLLRAQGIDARILNAGAHGVLGEIPFDQTYPELWLVDPADLDRARIVFEGFDRPVASGPDTICPVCAQESPASFAVCWHCGATLAP
jgi:hypothetical protein